MKRTIILSALVVLAFALIGKLIANALTPPIYVDQSTALEGFALQVFNNSDSTLHNVVCTITSKNGHTEWWPFSDLEPHKCGSVSFMQTFGMWDFQSGEKLQVYADGYRYPFRYILK